MANIKAPCGGIILGEGLIVEDGVIKVEGGGGGGVDYQPQITALENSKYDEVAIAGQKLSFKAKGVEKKSVTLPTQDISQMTTNKNDIATLKGQVADLISRVEALETP